LFLRVLDQYLLEDSDSANSDGEFQVVDDD
jgi:hypothetical protein